MCRQAVQCRRSMVFISKKWDVSMRKLEWKKKNRHWSHIADRQGFTLVELIVTFALLAIFMTAVVACLPNITKIYTNLQAINHQKTICNTVSNQIRNELQSALGVEGVDDALGANKSKEIAYIALIDDSGNPITLTTGGAVSTGGALSTGGAIQPDTVSGRTIEFVLRDGIIAQLDTKGFTGYTMRKNKKMLHRTRTISPGALLTRYYELDDSDNKLMGIQYNSTDYSVASDAGIVNEGPVTIACAIDYPYAGQFYEGYDLETTFTIKKDAFYSYGDGTTASPKRTYVSYINYTLSLLKGGQTKYSQDYVVNIQNAVPYLGTKVASDPVVPDVPEIEKPKVLYDKDAWVYLNKDRLPTNPNDPKYLLDVNFEKAVDEQRADLWVIQFPTNIKVIAAWPDSPNDGRFTVSASGSAIVIQRNTGLSFENLKEEDKKFTLNVHIDKLLEDNTVVDGYDHITCLTTPYTTRDNCYITNFKDDSHWSSNDSVVEFNILPKKYSVKFYMEAIYEKPIESVWFNNSKNILEVNGNTVRVYGEMLSTEITDPNQTKKILRVLLVGGDGSDKPVSVKFGK